MRDEMRKLNRPHLIAGQEAFTYSPQFRFPLDKTLPTPWWRLSTCTLPNTALGERSYQLGNFKSKELMLSEVADFCQAAHRHVSPRSSTKTIRPACIETRSVGPSIENAPGLPC
jgi:hypothetical protein